MEIISKEEQIMYENLITGSNGGIKLKKIPRLTKDQIKELVELRDQGYNDAITKLVLHNLGLVKKLASRYSSYYQNNYDDLFQEGVIGLIEAANNYDITKNASFGTYAWFYIRKTILRAIYDKGELVRTPVYIWENERKILSIRDELRNEFKREPTIEEISKISGIDYDDVNFILNVHKKNYSLDGPIMNDDEESSLIEVIPNEKAFNPEDISEKLDFQVVNEILEILTPRERQVIRLYFGFETGYMLTQVEVAKILDLCYQRIQQCETSAIERIRKSQQIKELIEKLDGYDDILGCVEEKLDSYNLPKPSNYRRDDVLKYFNGEDESDVRAAIDELTPRAKELFFRYYDDSLKRRPNHQLSKREIGSARDTLKTVKKNLVKISSRKVECKEIEMKIINKEEQAMFEKAFIGAGDERQVGNLPSLTKEQVEELIKWRDQGCKEAITKLVLYNLDLVDKIAREYSNDYYSYEDLFQDGVIELIKVAKNYDITKKKSFRKSAYKAIFKVKKIASSNNGLINLPSWVIDEETRILNTQIMFNNTFKREPTIEEISEMAGIDYDEVNFILHIRKEFLNLNESFTSGEHPLIETIPNENTSNPEDAIEKVDFQNFGEILNTLDCRKQQIIKLRFGIGDGQTRTRKEIGDVFGVTQQRIARLEERALKVLREKRKVKEFANYIGK